MIPRITQPAEKLVQLGLTVSAHISHVCMQSSNLFDRSIRLKSLHINTSIYPTELDPNESSTGLEEVVNRNPVNRKKLSKKMVESDYFLNRIQKCLQNTFSAVIRMFTFNLLHMNTHVHFRLTNCSS